MENMKTNRLSKCVMGEQEKQQIIIVKRVENIHPAIATLFQSFCFLTQVFMLTLLLLSTAAKRKNTHTISSKHVNSSSLYVVFLCLFFTSIK